jgi:hypothetical protein
MHGVVVPPPDEQVGKLIYFLRLSAPVEGDLWIRVQVKPLTMRYCVDHGQFRTRPVNVVDRQPCADGAVCRPVHQALSDADMLAGLVSVGMRRGRGERVDLLDSQGRWKGPCLQTTALNGRPLAR